MAAQLFPIKVFLEDTDAQGIVYHSNYLNYCERARTNLLRTLGFSLAKMHEEGLFMVVFEMHLKFHRPARLDEDLEIRTTVDKGSDYRLTFKQRIYRERDDKPIFAADVIVVAIDNDGRLTPLPETLDASAFGED
jgi:tol-pal system-associated acyl-CoA thioesterase